MKLPKARLKPREDLRIRRGHPWIYDNEIQSIEGGEPAPGGEILVADERNHILGTGFFNPFSKIRIRLFSRSGAPASADASFFEAAFLGALAWRKSFFDVENQSFRAVFGEADSVPGLIVDWFSGFPRGESDGLEMASLERTAPGRWLSVQFLSLGAEKHKPEILAALKTVFSPDGIYERSDAPVRKLEGLEASIGVLDGTVPASILIRENGARFLIDLAGGQKTGWFLDQRANRAAAARFASGRTVLDMFCNQGGFGVLAALSGARRVMAVDSSAEALAAAATNASLNLVSDKFETIEANAFDQLREFDRDGKKFDVVILDPPAFAKSRSQLVSARRGYKDINVRAIHLLPPGGILVSCSCSHWFGPELFDSMLAEAAFDCGRRYRTIEERSQDLDHPIVSGYDESRYLKCRILEIL